MRSGILQDDGVIIEMVLNEVDTETEARKATTF